MRLHGCSGRHEPTAQEECSGAIASVGRACKACWVACYRQGWPKPRVDADNKRLVAEHARMPRQEETDA